MKKYDVFAPVSGSKYFGQIESKDEKDALEKAENLTEENSPSFIRGISKVLMKL